MEFVFHHIGIATENIAKTIELYAKLGYSVEHSEITDPVQGVKLVFLNQLNHPLIELVAPASEKSPVHKILEKNGTTPYHTCYEISNMNQAIHELKKSKFIPIIKPVPAIAFDNRLICFLFHKNFGLLELVESAKSDTLTH